MSNLELMALEFATDAHKHQNRKYTFEPYITHPIAVAEIVRSVPHSPEMIAAALLHDVIEDCGVTRSGLLDMFGEEVSTLVWWLSDQSTKADGNRAIRKEIDRQHIAKAPAEAKTIKLADLLHNTESIASHDPDFWRVYRHEKMRLLEVLREGDTTLWRLAADRVGLEHEIG